MSTKNLYKYDNSESYFDVDGNLIEHKRRFPVRSDVYINEPVLVKKSNQQISGILLAYDVVNVKSQLTADSLVEQYYRYEALLLLSKNKVFRINRTYGRCADTELEVYRSKVVFIEKYKAFELFEKVRF